MNFPVKINFRRPFKVPNGYHQMPTEILCDSVSETAPVHRNDNVTHFAKLTADLSQISEDDAKKTIQRYPDGNDYYIFNGVVEATFDSASMEYVLVTEGECNIFLACMIACSNPFRDPV